MPINTGPAEDSYDDNTEYLIDTLPGIMANNDESGNWKLFSPIGAEIESLEADLQAVDRATSVQQADTIAQLEKLGKMVDLSINEGESKEHFRSRLFAQYQLNTTEGTIGDVIHTVSTILDVSPENIGYKQLDVDATVEVTMPYSAVDNLNLQESEVANILDDLVPAGYRILGQTQGTFTYVTPSTYTNTSDWAQYQGYDGLNVNDEPKQDGGTYAGIVN